METHLVDVLLGEALLGGGAVLAVQLEAQRAAALPARRIASYLVSVPPNPMAPNNNKISDAHGKHVYRSDALANLQNTRPKHRHCCTCV